MISSEIYSATGMLELINKVGFLPLLDSSISGFSAEVLLLASTIMALIN